MNSQLMPRDFDFVITWERQSPDWRPSVSAPHSVFVAQLLLVVRRCLSLRLSVNFCVVAFEFVAAAFRRAPLNLPLMSLLTLPL
jgi:hypothetical protein